jgi:hypothetical protein
MAPRCALIGCNDVHDYTLHPPIAEYVASSTSTLSRSLLPRSLPSQSLLHCKSPGRYCLYLTSVPSLTVLSRYHTCNATMAIDDLTAPQAAAPQPIDIEAWTEQATAAMGSVAISSTPAAVQETSVAFDIPLDEHDAPARPAPATTTQVHTVYKRKEPIRRDSLKRREELLKGKEGSRRRQRWENGTLP